MSLNQIFNDLTTLFNTEKNPTIRNRKKVLKKLKNLLIDNSEKISNALSEDYSYRNSFDSMMLDLLPSVNYINYSIKNLKKWMRKDKRHSGLLLFPSRIEIHYQPKGVVGVVVPWNFPIYLSIGPAITALSAGNRVMIKLSEFTPKTNKALIEILSPLSDHIKLFEGGVDIATEFTKLPFDHLLFTGSTRVGKIVAKAAAENLTPVTLELGGKSPVIITKSAHLKNAVNSILMGKIFNSGQICVAPDYVLIDKELRHEFINVFESELKELVENGLSDDMTHIINEQHFQRLLGYIKDAKSKGARIFEDSERKIDSKKRIILPTLVDDVTDDMDIMKEEIFGPLLPIMSFEKINEAIDYINSKSKPLALYIMSNQSEEIKLVLERTHSGGVCINDTVLQVGVDDAPFGGIGDSGLGEYHGKEGFLSLSKARTVLISKSFIPRSWLLLRKKDIFYKTLRRLFFK